MASWFHAISVAMEQWTAQHRAFVVEAYFKNGGSAVTTQRLFRRHFNIPRHGRVSCRNTLKEWAQNFRENASALKRKPRGRIPMVRTPENVDKVRVAIVKSPRRLVRRHSDAAGLSDRGVRRILLKDLNFHPYKIAIFQELSDRDMANRRISFEQLLEMLNDDGFINTVIMTDEAHFHLSGYVNKQSYRYCAPENPQELRQRPLHSERLTGVGSRRLEFLVLTSLKTTKVQPLLCHPSAMWQCYATSVSQSYVVVGSISRTIVELRQSRKEEIAEQMTRRVMENLGVRLKQCLRNGGRHLSDVLFKT